MNIKRVVIHGFKSYDDTTVFGPFSPGMNVIVGLNGSGKSNFYSAICFVLLDEYAQIRVSDRKALLHEGQGKNAMTAYVEIVFDNKNRLMPIENDEVSIRRSISLKKDEYFVDRKNSTRQDVHNLLEGCGFSPSNGYNIIRQGKIQELALMKDSERLDLLMEIAGTKFYDQQREESLKLIAESHGRVEKIQESLNYIEDRLKQLEDEKKELEENEKLEKEKKAVEFLIQKRELNSIENEINEKEQERESEFKSSEAYQSDFDEVHQKIKDKQEEMNEAKSSEKLLLNNKIMYENQKDRAIREQTRAEFRLKELQEKYENSDKLKNELKQKLEKLEQSISSTQIEYESVNSEFNEVADKKASVDGQLDGLQQIIGGKIKDPSSTENELSRAKNIYETLKKEANELEADVEQIKKNIDIYIQNKADAENEIQEIKKQQNEAKENQNQLMNYKKELWKKEDHIKRETRKVQQQLENYRSKLSRVMPPNLTRTIEAIKEIKKDGVYLPIFDLISCSDEISIAVNAVARSRLYYYVVENEDIAKSLIEYINKNDLGHISFLVLNRLPNANLKVPDGITTLISQLHFDEKFTNAIYKIFGRIALVETLKEGIEISSKYNIDCVTKEGDIINCSGPMVGGSRSQSKSPLLINAYIEKKEQKEGELKEALKEVKSKISETEEKLQETNSFINEIKYKKSNLENKRNEIISLIASKNDEYEVKLKQKDERNRRVDDAGRHIISVEKKLSYILEFNSQVDTTSTNKLIELRNESDKLHNKHFELLSKRIELSSRLKDRLKPRKIRIINQLEQLDISKIQTQLNETQKELEKATQSYTESITLGNQTEEELKEIGTKITDIEAEIAKLQREEDRYNKIINSHKKTLERIIGRISLLQQKQEETIQQQREIGTLPEAEIKELEDLRTPDLMRQLNIINENTKRYRHVNKKAIEQFRSFSNRQKELQKRQEEIVQSEESITSLIAKLDQKKDEAIANTFSQLSNNFTEIFVEMTSNKNAKLVLQKDEETQSYTGIAIHIQQGEKSEVITLEQLSGGQKTIVALSLVFAIQKFSPAPFYIFDEVDSALDEQYTQAVSQMIHKITHTSDINNAQIIFTSFKQGMVKGCDKYFAIKMDRSHSMVLEINEEEANRVILEKKEE